MVMKIIGLVVFLLVLSGGSLLLYATVSMYAAGVWAAALLLIATIVLATR